MDARDKVRKTGRYTCVMLAAALVSLLLIGGASREAAGETGASKRAADAVVGPLSRILLDGTSSMSGTPTMALTATLCGGRAQKRKTMVAILRRASPGLTMWSPAGSTRGCARGYPLTPT